MIRMTTSSSTSVNPSSARRRERSISPGCSAGERSRFSSIRCRRPDGHRGPAPGRRARASKRPVPSHHGQRTRCGSPPRPEISSPVPRQAVQVLGSCSVGALIRRESLEARRCDASPSGPARARRPSGRPTCRSAASGASWAGSRGRSAGAAGRRRGTRSRRSAGSARGTARPARRGRRAASGPTSASNASGFIASLSCSGPSGLVNSSAPVGAASSSPRSVSAEPPMLVHSQPSMPCSRGTTAVAERRRSTGKRPACAADLGRAAVDEADVQLPERELAAAPAGAVDLEGRAVRAQPQGVGRHAATRLEGDRERCGRPRLQAGVVRRTSARS